MSVLEGKRREVRRVIWQGSEHWCEYEGGRIVFADGRSCEEKDVVHLPPCLPTKIICVHVNYISRYYEFNNTRVPPKTPTYFQKPLTALNSHGGELIRPAGYKYVNYEGEMAVVFGKVTRNVTREEAWDCIAGFAPANDFGCHDFRDTDSGSMLRVKGMDGFCPIGPGVVSGVDVRKSVLRSYRNGRMVQEGAISEQIFDCGYLIADLARHMTFLPGDILLTGTPANSRPLDVGDTIEVEVSDVGRLSNKVVEIPAPRSQDGFPASPNSEGVVRVAMGNEERLPDKFKTKK
jgi:5-oxopent-3-ene-1,2,5-tricarboxylate decarboxylase/2-hydroxyhepta-2,4-diene-1,7-dioate isomerase